MMLKLFEVLFTILHVNFSASVRSFVSNKDLDKNLQVTTTKGIIQGRKVVTYDGFPYFSYQGIPFAQPPIGDLRFRAPISAKPWKGVLDARKEQSGCVEEVGNLDKILSSSGDEDCLYVNIYTSKNPQTTQQLLPVLVWIYGGAFLFGNSSTAFYGPDKLVKKDIIIVTFNYRIGLFGFLSTEDLSSPGNYGLKDQNLVLRWVQKNIKNFGGDKNRVTLSGQSAGAASVMYHVVSPKSRGLFHRAIANSGSQLCAWAIKTDAKKSAFDIGLGSGIKTNSTKELVARLRKTDISILRKVTYLAILVGIPQVPFSGFPFGPVVEPPHKGAFFTGNTVKLFETGKFNRVPIMMGFTTAETLIFSDVLLPLKPFFTIFDVSPGLLPNRFMNIRTSEDRRQAGLKIKKHYIKDESYLDTKFSKILDQTNDDYFIRPLIRTIQLIYKYIPVYSYLFSYISEFGLKSLPLLSERYVQGTAHVEDLMYIWHWSFNNAPYPCLKDNMVTHKMLELWENFIATGNPTPKEDKLLDDVVWPAVSSAENITYLNIDANLSLIQNYRIEHLRFWDDLYEEYGHPPYMVL